MRIVIFANAFHTISGGDKIFVEFAKYWIPAGEKVKVITNKSGRLFAMENGLAYKHIQLWPASFSDKLGIFISSAYKTTNSLVRSFFISPKSIDVIFSASFIWPDLFPGLILKLKKPQIKWIVACYVFLPNPFLKTYRGNRFNGIILYLVQKISLILINLFADAAFVASKLDLDRFSERVHVKTVRGGVDYHFFSKLPTQRKVFDAVFVGRFHPQKNVDDLLDIWKNITKKRRGAKLALIGGGYMEDELKEQVYANKMGENILFLGILDGLEKARILKSSKVFLSASKFDSGNIALDEALASGVPGVVYNLPRLDYPEGVVKIPRGDERDFTKAVLGLLEKEKWRRGLSVKGQRFASSLDWNIKAKEALSLVRELYAQKK